jgi:hypothetical protein
VILFELNMPFDSHSMVNGAFLKHSSSSKKQTTIVCTNKHFDALGIQEKNVKHINVNLEEFKLKKDNAKSKLGKFLITFKFIFSILRKTQESEVLFLSLNEYDLLSIYFLNKLRPKIQIHGIIHSNLNHIKINTGRNPYHKFFGYHSCIKRIKHKNVHIIVLEELIYRNMREQYPELCSNLSVVPHPIDGLIERNNTFSIGRYKAGVAGTLTGNKNIEAVLKLVKLCKEDRRILGFSIEYYMYLPSEFASHIGNDLSFPLQPTRLTNDDIQRFYNSVDFIIWFHGADKYYNFSASGILLDAVKFHTPLLALNCIALESFESKYGKISVSGDNPAEIIENLVNLDADIYQSLLKNMAKLRDDRLYTSIQLQ